MSLFTVKEADQRNHTQNCPNLCKVVEITNTAAILLKSYNLEYKNELSAITWF